MKPEIGWFLPPLLERMRRLAPGMVLEVNSEPREHFGQLERGEVHFVLSPFQPSAGTDQLHRLRLAPLTFALVMSADNPLAKGTLSVERFAAATDNLDDMTASPMVAPFEHLALSLTCDLEHQAGKLVFQGGEVHRHLRHGRTAGAEAQLLGGVGVQDQDAARKQPIHHAPVHRAAQVRRDMGEGRADPRPSV